VPVRVSLDGPRLPWQEVTFTTSGVGDQPVHIEVSADSGTRIVTTGSIPVTVTFDAGESALSTLTSTSSGVLSVPARSALD
jgi:hypothetical protein